MTNDALSGLSAESLKELAIEQGDVDLNFVNSLVNQVIELQVKLKDQQDVIAELERDAMYDPLTQLKNRRIFHDELQRSLAAARRYNRQSALLVVDVDNFKSINDQLGHLAGDKVLEHVAGLLSQNTRPTDVVARLGGDEFVVILNEVSSLKGVEKRVQNLSETVAHTPCVLENRHIRTTVSIGFYVFDADDDPQDIMQHADDDMYAQKAKKKA